MGMKEIKNEIDELHDGKTVTGFWAVMNVIGGVGGLTSLVIVAVFMGGLKKQVEINTNDIADIQKGGSPTLKATIEGLRLEIESRKESDLLVNKRLDDLRSEVVDRIHTIATLQQEQIVQQTALIALIRAQQQVKP